MIPVNPEAIGDPNQTPVVYLGETAGKALGIPQRDPTPPSPTQRPTGQADLDAIRRRVEAATPGSWTAHDDGLVWPERMGDPVSGSTELADAEFIAHARTDVPALLADLDAARAKLNVVCDILTATQAERDEVARELGSEALRWRAERDRMRPVVEAVGEMIAERNARHGKPDNPAWWSGWDFKIVAAWDTYETQTGGTE